MTIEYASQFKKDYKTVSRGRHRKRVEAELKDVLPLLQAGQPLPQRYQDHPLGGDWNGYRDCHLAPDLVLIYKVLQSGTVRLARLGSHSELF
jgi:mRNA interferase YafQ